MFGCISRGVFLAPDNPPIAVTCRDWSTARWWAAPLASYLARRELRALRRLGALPGVPRLVATRPRALLRTYLSGSPMQVGAPRDPGYFRRARRLLMALHRRGVVHNDLAKEPNWLVRPDGSPAVVDFQLASVGPRRGAWRRMLAREDLRHLLKHKRTYCPDALTDVERRLLAHPSEAARALRRTIKPPYNLVTRRLLRWSDNEGRGPEREPGAAPPP